MKRALDVMLSLIALALLSPVIATAAVAIGLESGRPVLFRQTRLGLRGREFAMYKFRSMVANAASIGPYHTAADDPRVTRVGRYLRRTSIDELPQLFNVLTGDMSLVGPRPDVPAQRAGYTDADWAERCSVRPGITGLAQALLRSDATAAQRLALDLRYAREHSLWLDCKIMLMTLARVSGKGSN
ncbi:sugar transferase [Caenimonas soli]|uniref:sugar transferase n=1 Tax=Caenimonas soli TaxID=2735555 RepID=UPI001551DBAB|nr:sugar transferase [Caenimonas soli]NPC56210.1 sugar transferase [Caenimonas soli]